MPPFIPTSDHPVNLILGKRKTRVLPLVKRKNGTYTSLHPRFEPGPSNSKICAATTTGINGKCTAFPFEDVVHDFLSPETTCEQALPGLDLVAQR